MHSRAPRASQQGMHERITSPVAAVAKTGRTACTAVPVEFVVSRKEDRTMRRMVLKRILGTGLGLMVATGVQAELLNISTNAMQSQNTPTAACTIVGKGGKTLPSGAKVLVVLAEGKATDSNPTISIRFSDNATLSNDNWNSTTIDASGKPVQTDPAGWLGRSPGRQNDAGTVVLAIPGEWLCVTSREVSGGDALRPVAVSVTDVTERAAGAKSAAISADAGLRPDALPGSPR